MRAMNLPFALALLGACAGDAPKDDAAGSPTETDLDTAASTDTGSTRDPFTGVGPANALVSVTYEAGSAFVDARFYAEDFGSPPPPLEYGSCYVTLAEEGTSTGDSELVFLAADDPTVTIGGTPVALTGSDGIYTGTAPTWPAGEPVGFSISGGGMQAFDLPDLVVLPSVPVAAPWPASIDRSEDLAVAWTPSGESKTLFLTSAAATVICLVEDATGQATVPAAALAHLGAGRGTIGLRHSSFVFEDLPDGELVVGLATAESTADVALE